MTQPIQQTQGGYRTAALYSGQVVPALTGVTGGVAVGSDVLVWSGQGRLNSVLVHQLSSSGVAINFYDGIAPISGGPLASSGHIPLGFVPAITTQASGVAAAFEPGGWEYGTPFFNGLCVNSRSGQVGVTITFTPEMPQV